MRERKHTKSVGQVRQRESQHATAVKFEKDTKSVGQVREREREQARNGCGFEKERKHKKSVGQVRASITADICVSVCVREIEQAQRLVGQVRDSKHIGCIAGEREREREREQAQRLWGR